MPLIARQFKAEQYVEQGWVDFLRWKFTNLPSIKEARDWKTRFSGGPMTSEEFSEYCAHVGEDNAIAIRDNRVRTLFGWYLQEWNKWLTFWSLVEYNKNVFDSHLEFADEEYSW
jgi:hypothetical protein